MNIWDMINEDIRLDHNDPYFGYQPNIRYNTNSSLKPVLTGVEKSIGSESSARRSVIPTDSTPSKDLPTHDLRKSLEDLDQPEPSESPIDMVKSVMSLFEVRSEQNTIDPKDVLAKALEPFTKD